MEKERKTRLIIIIVLCISVFGLSIGFAAFTRDLNIQFSDTNVNISGDLDVRVLASNDPADDSFIINGHGCVSNYATISSNRTTISGLEADFSSNGQIGTYDFYIYNASEYDAYLKSVDFLNYLGADTNKVCTAMEGTNQDMVDDACEDIHITLASDVDGDGSFSDDELMIDTGVSNISSVKLPKGNFVYMAIIISYADEFDGGTSLLPNGDFKVNFGDIKINFSSLEG